MNHIPTGAPDDGWQPRGIDVHTPSTARIYDYVIGGKDNYPADREAAGKLIDVLPEVVPLAKLNRTILHRICNFATRMGIRQFIDVGTGIPTQPATHEMVAPDAQVVYVDNDPIALAHARAILAEGETSEKVTVIDADMRHPETITENERLNRAIDWNQPVCVLMLLMLHFVTDEDDPRGIVRHFRDRMTPGSFFAMTHVSGDEAPPEVVRRFEDVYNSATSTLTFRSDREIRHLLHGFQVIEPGLGWLQDFWLDIPPRLDEERQRAVSQASRFAYAAVARR